MNKIIKEYLSNTTEIFCESFSKIKDALDIGDVDLFIESAAGKIQLVDTGVGTDFDEEVATAILSEQVVIATADIKMGDKEATAWGCDLTHGYIDINADYRS